MIPRSIVSEHDRWDGPTVGHIYTVAGRGEMKLDMILPNCLVFRAHGNYHVWCSKDSVVKEATQEDLYARDAQAYPRNVHCQDPECWCHPVIRPPAPVQQYQPQITHGTCSCGHQVTCHTYEDAGNGQCRVPKCACLEFKPLTSLNTKGRGQRVRSVDPFK